tara:strand:+ start:310 stop:606 length:297 start_codon:yes stop_codon:yes gene_type:complete
MKITIQKTMYLDEVPEEIDNEFLTISNRMIGAKQLLGSAAQNSTEGRYLNASEDIEKIREVLSIIDKNLEEQQSLCLSYEKIRIDAQFQTMSQEADNV